MKNETFKMSLFGMAFALLCSYAVVQGISNTESVAIAVVTLLVFVAMPVGFFVYYFLHMFKDKDNYFKPFTFFLSYVSTVAVVFVSMLVIISFVSN